jgi:hypothetical protein
MKKKRQRTLLQTGWIACLSGYLLLFGMALGLLEDCERYRV